MVNEQLFGSQTQPICGTVWNFTARYFRVIHSLIALHGAFQIIEPNQGWLSQHFGSRPQSQASPLIYLKIISAWWWYWRRGGIPQNLTLRKPRGRSLGYGCCNPKDRKKYWDVNLHSSRRKFDTRLSHIIWFLMLVSCALDFVFWDWLGSLDTSIALIFEKSMDIVQHSCVVVTSVDSILNIRIIRGNRRPARAWF